MLVVLQIRTDLRQKKSDFISMERRFRFCRTPPSIWPMDTGTKCHRTESSSFLSEIIAEENPPLEIVRWLRKNRPHLKVVQINLLATFHFSSSKNWIRRHNTSLPDNKRMIASSDYWFSYTSLATIFDHIRCEGVTLDRVPPKASGVGNLTK